MAKQKQIKIKKDSRVFGATLDGVKYISNGHWMMRQDLVDVSNEMTIAMETQGHFTFYGGKGQNMDLARAAVDFKPILGSLEIEDLAPATHVNVVFPDGGIPGRGGLTPYISEDNPEDGVSYFQVKYLEPLEGFQAYREKVDGELKPLRFFRGEDLVAIVMPCRAEDTPGMLSSLVEAHEMHKAKKIEDSVKARKSA